MGTVAVAIKRVDRGIGDHTEVTADVTLSNSYATGGDTLTPALLGLKTVRAVIVCSNANGYNVQMIHPSSEVANLLVKMFQGDNANAGAAPGIEVPNATNLSAVTVRVVAKGDHATANAG